MLPIPLSIGDYMSSVIVVIEVEEFMILVIEGNFEGENSKRSWDWRK